MRAIPFGHAGRVTRTPMKLVVLLGLATLLVAGCGSASTVSAPATPVTRQVVSISVTAVVSTTTATPATCASAQITPPPGVVTYSFALPPNTIIGYPDGAAGAGFNIVCTMGATQASITTFMNASLAQAGWQRWNPQTQDAHGCGTEPNDFWQWYKNDASGGGAVGWMFVPPLPYWTLVGCDLAYGR